MVIKIDAKVIDLDYGYKALERSVRTMKPISAVAGLVKGKTPNEVIEYGAKNHFGDEASGIPSRPFLTQAWDTGGEEVYATMLIERLHSWFYPGAPSAFDPQGVVDHFDAVAKVAANDIQDAIRAGKFAPNSAQTIAEKGANKPLIDSGRLLASIESDVRVGKRVFKEPMNAGKAAKAILSPGKGASKRKRKRKVGFRRKNPLSSLAKSPGYGGKGIRKRAESRAGRAAPGVVSRGVRRR